jgi:glutamate synthase (NADPH/NADH) small chain
MPSVSEKIKMPQQDPQVRRNNFNEVTLGYTPEMAVAEAKRCLNCKSVPCMTGCPVSVQIPDFIAEIKNGEFEKAYDVIKETNALPAVCGRVCPQETQCECVRGLKGEPVAIGRLERFAADYHRLHGKTSLMAVTPNGKKVAVVGAGPAGLTCAGELIKKGYEVTIFEALHSPGGVLIYGETV